MKAMINGNRRNNVVKTSTSVRKKRSSGRQVKVKESTDEVEDPITAVHTRTQSRMVDMSDDESYEYTPRKNTSSGRQVKRKQVRDGNEASNSKVRPCHRAHCRAKRPTCVIRTSPGCAREGYTSRWYHISEGEHFCNECFEHYYRSHKDGYSDFTAWKTHWACNGKTEATLHTYVCDQLMPYWLRCTKDGCGKWRQLAPEAEPLTMQMIKCFVCGMQTTHGSLKGACSLAEDERVSAVWTDEWVLNLLNPPYLQQSPAAPYMGEYYPDGVGLTASVNIKDNTNCHIDGATRLDYHTTTDSLIQPFSHPCDSNQAGAVRPDIMNQQETEEFSEYSYAQQTYLGLRNLVLAVWKLNCKEWVTVQRCEAYLICRGLVRLKCHQLLQDIIQSLTVWGSINYGLLSSPPAKVFPSLRTHNEEVIIIGASIAGLSAAKYLQNAGIKVVVLERCARHREDTGSIPYRGPVIIPDCVNNPLTYISIQGNLKLHQLPTYCDLILENGELVAPPCVRRMDFHLKSLLDNVAECRKSHHSKDFSLLDKLKELHSQFLEESQLVFNEEEAASLEHHMGQLEYQCGANLDSLSGLHWDQHEQFPQYSEPNGYIDGDINAIISKMAEDVHVEYNHKVCSVDYTDSNITVCTERHGQFKASRVISAVSLCCLKEGSIVYNPAIPDDKKQAINKLGVGKLIKIIMLFPYKFWNNKMKRKVFGYASKDENHGLFSMFYDVSNKQDNILFTTVCGSGIKIVQGLSEEQLVSKCLQVLRNIFPGESICEPTVYKVLRTSTSYLPVGCSGKHIDSLAQDITGKIYFTGQATNRAHPGTVAGSYLSGVRDAKLIIDSLSS